MILQGRPRSENSLTGILRSKLSELSLPPEFTPGMLKARIPELSHLSGAQFSLLVINLKLQGFFVKVKRGVYRRV